MSFADVITAVVAVLLVTVGVGLTAGFLILMWTLTKDAKRVGR